jgi:hypothetical protein
VVASASKAAAEIALIPASLYCIFSAQTGCGLYFDYL